ncbi:hypothetical protein L3Q82_007364 [Scortum barcoo]|uniref:Uncharacterized protein n=1 Tax=Scortum barcoo TaxID=214431 RepID=A0ACB8WVX4_9TELE|nr:hypothetical protein L3Q82_007364 [Scortum barcoo]
MFSASIVDAHDRIQFEVVDARSLVPVVAATPNPVVDTGIDAATWQANQASRSWSLDGPGGKNFGSGRSSVKAMEEDYRSASKRFWQTVRHGASEGGRGSSTLPTLFTVQVGSC